MVINKPLMPTAILGSFVIVGLLAGCAAVETSVAKRNLDVQTKTSTAIFVDPIARAKRLVYVEVRSGIMEFDRRAFRREVMNAFADNDSGYKVTDDPDAAPYHMNIFVTALEKNTLTAAERALNQGYSDVGAGALVGGVVGADNGHGSLTSTAIGSVVGAVATTAANAWVQDVTYMLVADVKITEITRRGAVVRKNTHIDSKVSDAGYSTQQVDEFTNRKEYTTRIVTTANKANLTLEEAQPLMFQKTAYAMSGFF